MAVVRLFIQIQSVPNSNPSPKALYLRKLSLAGCLLIRLSQWKFSRLAEDKGVMRLGYLFHGSFPTGWRPWLCSHTKGHSSASLPCSLLIAPYLCSFEPVMMAFFLCEDASTSLLGPHSLICTSVNRFLIKLSNNILFK